MHFTVLRLLIIVALLVVLSRAYSNDVFEARDYIDGLSARTDASVSSLSTREIMAELSERLERRKSDTEMKYECAKCHATSNTAVWNPKFPEHCPQSAGGIHSWMKKRK